MSYKTELQIYVATLDDTIDNVGTLGAKLQEFSRALDLAAGVIETVDTIGDLADAAKKAIDTELTVLKLTKLAGPLKIPSKIFEKVLKTIKPVIEKIDNAVDKLNGKKDASGNGSDGQGDFLNKLSTALDQASTALGTIADQLQQKALDMHETREAANEFIDALDHANFTEYSALKIQVETQFSDRNAVTAPLADAFNDVAAKVNGVLGVISDAKFELVTQDVGDFAEISDLLAKIGEPLSAVAAIIKPVEWLLNSVGFIVDLVLGPIFDLITKTLGIDKLIQGIADDIKALLPDAAFLDPLVAEVQGLLDSVRDFNTTAFGINDLLVDIESTLYGGVVGNALLGPTGIGSDASETLFGNAGDDLLDARGGDDVVQAGDGNDVIVAGEGNDRVFGGSGSDMVYFAGFFNEYELAISADGRIIITHVRPAPGTQNEGSTWLDSIEHVVFRNISFTGAELEDAIIGGSVLNGTNGDDLMFLNSTGTPNADGQHVVNGLGGDDRIFGSTKDDELNGGSGDDVLIPGLGVDEANGGAGSDSYQILDSGSNSQLRIDLQAGTVLGYEGNDKLNSIENLIIQGNGDHFLSGSTANNNLLTAGGDDVVAGRDGDDFINTGDGRDVIITGAGQDRVLSGDDNDLILAASLSVVAQDEYFDGGRSYDILSYSSDYNVILDLISPEPDLRNKINASMAELNGGTGSLRIDAGTGTIEKLNASGVVIATDTAVNIEVFVGSDNDDVLTGAQASFQNSVHIHGAGGNDKLLSNGATQISGGDGDDRLVLTTSDPGGINGIFDGGSGHDVLNLRQAGEVRWWLSLIGSNSQSGLAYNDDYIGNMRSGGSSIGRIKLSDINEFFFADGAHVIDNDPQSTGSQRIFHTGKGDDYLNHKSGYAVFDAGEGDDFARLESQAKVLGGAGDDRMVFDHNMSGNEAAGGAGNDWVTLERFMGSTAKGGTGYDTLAFDTIGFGVDVDLRAQTVVGIGANSSIDAEIKSFERVIGSEQSDDLDGTKDNETLIGRGGNDLITGRDGDDQLFGGAGNDTLEGGDGNDRLHGGAGNDFLKGGKGNDTAVYSYAAPDGLDAVQVAGSFGGVVINLGLAVASGSFGNDTITGIENVIGSAGNDTLIGDNGRNFLSGEAGDDVLNGLGGNDMLVLGPGDDTAFGGDGKDRIIVGTGTNTVNGGNGKDRLEFGSETGQITLNFKTNSFAGTLNVGQPVWQDTGTTETRLFNGVSLTPQQVKETQALYANDASDLTRALPDSDDPLAGLFRIIDRLRPTQTQGDFSEIETVVGGNAAVTILLSGGHDSYDGTLSDSDFLDFSAKSSGVRYNITTGATDYGRASGDDLTGIDGIIGGTGNDRFIGDDAANILKGQGGNDTLLGRGGADRLLGGDGRDTLEGGDGQDVLKGGEGRDVLKGGNGADQLNGGAGNDTLHGGNGSDSFIFTPGGGRDHIDDFQNDQDQLDLRSYGFSNVGKALAKVTMVDGDVVFDFGNNNVLVVENITKTALSDDILV